MLWFRHGSSTRGVLTWVEVMSGGIGGNFSIDGILMAGLYWYSEQKQWAGVINSIDMKKDS